MEVFRVTQKQTHTPLNSHHSVQNSPTLLTPVARSPKAAFLFTGLTALAAAAVATVALATDHDPSLTHFQLTKSPMSHGDTKSSESSTSTIQSTVTIDNAQSSTQSASAPPQSPPTETTTSGSIIINDEVLPVSEGTTSRTFVDENGAIHSVTVTVDNQTYTSDSSSSHTDIIINSDSSSSSGNTTRGSPRR